MFKHWHPGRWRLLVGWSCVACAATVQSAQKPLDPGHVKPSANAPAGTLPDGDRALKPDPKSAAEYAARGNAEQEQGKRQEAMVDYNRAIELAPTQAGLYTGRAILKGLLADPQGAIADHTKAIELDPNSADSYSDRGMDKLQTGDLAGAASDCDKGVELEPESPEVYRNRGILRQATSHWQEALEDYQRAIERGGDDDGYTQFYSWLERAHGGLREVADRELTDYMRKMWPVMEEKWSGQVAGFLLGKVKEDAFLNAASSSDANKDAGQHCEAFYYAGMVRLLAGDKDAAAEDFRRCLATGKRTFTEYQFAKAELAALQTQNQETPAPARESPFPR